jgi:hypothetical protein
MTTMRPVDPTRILYARPETFIKLLETKRARKREDDVAFIRERDHEFANMALMVSDQVAPGAIFRRMVRAEGGGVIFIFAGTV